MKKGFAHVEQTLVCRFNRQVAPRFWFLAESRTGQH